MLEYLTKSSYHISNIAQKLCFYLTKFRLKMEMSIIHHYIFFYNDSDESPILKPSPRGRQPYECWTIE